MGLFDDLGGQLGSILDGAGQNDFMSTAVQMLGGSGGLNGLVDMFNKAGLGEQVQSWISTGANLPISGEQLKNVFNSDTLSSIAPLLGTNASGVADMLANMLPGVIDQLTPNGKLE